MSLLTAITTCKGRLEHLRQSLPTWMAQPDLEVVVVDYDCPDGAADWVRANWPKARVVEVDDRPLFNRSIARNLGAAAASGEWLFFVDADVVAADGFVSSLSGLLKPGVFLLAKPRPPELWGALVVSHADFDAVGGYDEAFEGWGGEDVDIIEQLMFAGVKEAAFPGDGVKSIPHDQATRTRFQELKDVRLSGAINGFYRTVKNDLVRQHVVLDLEGRRKLYADVRRAFAGPGGAQSFQVAFRRTTVSGLTMQAILRYDLSFAAPAR
jgi:glycosyltransferase involved in cell wall biosynthesis